MSAKAWRISEIRHLLESEEDAPRTLYIREVEGKELTVYDVAGVIGDFGAYVVIEAKVAGESGRCRIGTTARPIVDKLRRAKELGYLPLRGSVVRLGDSWDIV